uniref:LRAT domain-containing protein n=1 Tax=Fundulus heteroclitus TaxID=8078 RepID=A0A3Q2QR76_FUNHE
VAPWQNGKQPNPGDLIEIFRSGYQHWAVYIGDGYVVHLVRTSESALAPGEMANVKKEKLEEVVGNDPWKINNDRDKIYKPQPIDEIVKQAEKLIGKEQRYNMLDSNCEHFATELRYEKPESQQVGQRRLEQRLALIVSMADDVQCGRWFIYNKNRDNIYKNQRLTWLNRS